MIILFILFIFVLYVIYAFLTSNRSVAYKDFGDPSHRKICFIAGVHGNEPAASLLLHDMLKTDFFERISSNNKLFIRVLPGVNEFGLALRIRYQNSFRHPDINRNFVGEGLDHISKEIIKLTKDMDLIVDFHEGWGFHLLQPKSLGSTLTLTEGARPLGQLIINNLNKTIANEKHKFVIVERMCDIEEALSCYSNRHGKEYILVETSGQNNIQSVDVRQSQIKTIIDTCLNNLKISNIIKQ
jgi:hypothetical protein